DSISNISHYPTGNYVIQGANPETVTVSSVSNVAGKITLVLNPPAELAHASGDIIMLAPGSNNTCEHWLNGVQLTPQYHYVENPLADVGISQTDLSLIENGGATIYTNSCPANTVAAWSGPIVIKGAPPGGWSMAASSNQAMNSVTVPGFVIERASRPRT